MPSEKVNSRYMSRLPDPLVVLRLNWETHHRLIVHELAEELRRFLCGLLV